VRPEEERLAHKTKKIVITKETIGARLRDIRRAQGMSQNELAEKLGTIQSHVSDMERGLRKPTIQQLANLSQALHVSVDQLLALEKPPANGVIHDRRFLRRLQQIDKLSKRDQQSLLGTIDAFLSKLS
jgi:transcriptional regulator with XRE-family HTH domain